jgi:hypothetical protein
MVSCQACLLIGLVAVPGARDISFVLVAEQMFRHVLSQRLGYTQLALVKGVGNLYVTWNMTRFSVRRLVISSVTLLMRLAYLDQCHRHLPLF